MPIHTGDALTVLRSLPATETFTTCLTSPPYFQLCDYQVEGQLGFVGADLDQYFDSLTAIMAEVQRRLVEGGVAWIV